MPPQAPSFPSADHRFLRGWAVLQTCWRELGKHGIYLVINCSLIAIILWALRQGTANSVSFVSQWIYSMSIGCISWLIIDLGRFFIDQDSPYFFPRGWKSIALIATGVVMGFLAGTLLSDTLTGRNTWAMLRLAPNAFAYMVTFSLATGFGISFFFYARGRQAYMQAELEKTQRQATQAQLKLLQSQLDPHMLFNTLANLRALIPDEPARAVQMLDQLNDFLRSTLSASRSDMHPLQAEFDRLRDYLSLMQVRMGQRLTYTLELPEELGRVQVPTLILQSLVENAIVHGLEPKLEGGAVMISAQREGDTLLLQVQDNGLGFDAAQMQEGFGLTQVRERGLQIYGNAFTIDLIASCAVNLPAIGDFGSQKASQEAPQAPMQPVSGCTVRMRLPMKANPQS